MEEVQQAVTMGMREREGLRERLERAQRELKECRVRIKDRDKEEALSRKRGLIKQTSSTFTQPEM